MNKEDIIIDLMGIMIVIMGSAMSLLTITLVAMEWGII